MKHLSERDLIEQVLSDDGTPLPEAAYQPLASLIEQAFSSSKRTTRVYRRAFGLFLQYLETQRFGDLPPAAKACWCPFAVTTRESRRSLWDIRPPAAVLRWVDKHDLDGFMTWRAAEGDNASTILTRVAAVRSLLRVAHQAGIVDEQQSLCLSLYGRKQRQEHILASSGREPTGRWLTSAEVRLLRGVVETSTKSGKRDLALLDCMLYLGLRPDELRSLTWSDFEPSSTRWLTLESDQPSKGRRLKVHPILRLSLLTWFSTIDFWQEPADTPLFVNIHMNDIVGRRAITTQAIKLTVNFYGDLAGITLPAGRERLTPIVLRRTCGRRAYENGASLKQVQELLGLSSLDLTAHFIGAFDRDAKTAVDYIRYD